MVRFGGWCRTVISLGNGPDSHSLGQIHSLQVALCLVPEEWPRVGNGLGSAIGDRHSLGQTHSLQVTLCLSVGGMAQGGEWSRLRNRDNYSSLLERNSLDNSLSMFYFLREDALPDLTYVSGRMA